MSRCPQCQERGRREVLRGVRRAVGADMWKPRPSALPKGLQGGPYFADIERLRDGLKELGRVEGKHFMVDVRDTKGDLTMVESAARTLKKQRVDLIYSITTSVTLATKLATKSVPIVFVPGQRLQGSAGELW